MGIPSIFIGIMLSLISVNSAWTAQSPIPPELHVSLEMRERMNELAVQYGFHRLETIQKLNQLLCVGAIIRVEAPRETPSYYLDFRSKGVQRYPYLRPFAKKMMGEIAEDFFAEHNLPPVISSLARTVPYQLFLELTKVSDAKESNPRLRSAHPDANAFDISKALEHRLMNERELNTLRRILAYREREGAIDAIEERGSFHITVSPEYAKFLYGNFLTDDELIEAQKEECPFATVLAEKNEYPVKKPANKKSPKRRR